MKKITLMFLALFVSGLTWAQCVKDNAYQDRTINNTGAVEGVVTNQWSTEHSTVSGFVDGDDYEILITLNADGTHKYVTISEDGNDANVLAFGQSPFMFTATAIANLKLSWSDDAGPACEGTEALHTTSIQNLTVAANVCLDPSDLAVSNITDMSSDLSWTDNGIVTVDFNVEVYLAGESAAGANTPVFANANVAGTMISATGLAASTDYDAYITTNCSGATANSALVGPESFTTTAACSDVTDIEVANITDTGANITWTIGTGNDAAMVEVYASGESAANGDTAVYSNAAAAAGSDTASGLMGNTDYDVFVTGMCGAASTTVVGPESFTTACSAFTPDYTESFDVFIPDCWIEAGAGDPTVGPSDLGGGLWNHTDFLNDGSPDNSVKINLYTTNREDWLLSPSFDLSGGSYELVYTVAVTDYNNSDVPELNGMGSDDEVQILVSTDQGATWINLETYNQANMPSNTGDVETIDLAAYTGTVQFAIWATDGTVDDDEDYDFFIDEFKVRTPPSCVEPIALMIDNALFNSVDFSWTESGTATAWDIELVDITAAGVATGTPTTDATSDNPFEISGLVAENDYEVYVRANCGGDTSVWVGPLAFTTPVACPAPSDLAAVNFTETSADLSWMENGSATVYNVELGETGFTPTGTPTATGVSNPYMATGLTIATVYDYYVQANCNAEGTSEWSGPFTFSTSCGFADVPFMEDFQTGGACGLITNEGSGNAWQVVDVTSYGFAPNHLRYTYNGANVADSWFFTQGINLTAGQDYMISYDYGGTGTTYPEKLKVAYGTSTAAAAMTTELADYPMVNSDTPVNDMQTFAVPADGVYYIGFQAYSDANQFYLHLDNISVDVALSVGDVENETAFTYYPNPVKNTLTLNAQNTIEQVAMYNMLGQEVLRATPNSVDSNLDMSQLQTGTYFVKVTIANVTETIRVIKQ